MQRLAWCLAAVCFGSSLTSAAPRQPFAEGRPFPLLALPDLARGRPTSLADFRGRKLVLHVFASW